MSRYLRSSVAVHGGMMEDGGGRPESPPRHKEALDVGDTVLDQSILSRSGYKGYTPMIWLHEGNKGGHKRLHGGGEGSKSKV